MIIERRFRGPAESGNGGYVCGALGTLVSGPAEVSLRIPPPLERELGVERLPDGSVQLLAGEIVVATAAPKAVEVTPPEPVPFDEAVKASRGFPWTHTHPFPSCFVCGTDRAGDGGLQIFCGAVEGRKMAAAPWIPDASLADPGGRVRPEMVWAALDCPSWFGMYCFDDAPGMALLGRQAVRIDRLPRVSERCVCTGWFLERDGRKVRTASALHGENGEMLAIGKSTWVFLK